MLLVCPNESVAVIVYDRLINWVGVPVIFPFDALNDNPLGSVGVIENEIVPYPPDAPTGETLAVSIYLSNSTVALFCIVTNAGGSLTVNV